MSSRLVVLCCLATAACGGEGSWQRCGSSAECPAGTFCDAPVSGERGVCQAPGTVALTAPAAGAYVGASASLSATLTLASAALSPPASVELRLGGAPVATLALQGTPAGQVATYAGTWNPGAAQNGPGSLDAAASVDVAGAAVPLTSPAVAVIVDTLPPLIQNATATCAGGCKRDSTLDVSANATDPNLLAVAVSLDLEPTRPVGVTRSGDAWSASVPLGQWPFPYFQRTAQVTVRAADKAGNESTVVLPVDVTRLRWAGASEPVTPPQLTAPAVAADGTIVAGASNSKLYFFDMSGNVVKSLAVGSIGITAAPSIGPTAIWAASNDGKVYAVALDGSGIVNGGGCNTLSIPVGVPALFGMSRDVAVQGSTAAQALYAVRVTSPLCNATPAGESFAASAAVAADGAAYAVTRSGTGATTLRSYTAAVGDIPTPGWTVPAGTSVVAPLTLDGQGRVIVCSLDGSVVRITNQGASGSSITFASLPAQAETSPIVLVGGDVVVGLMGGSVHRLSDNGTPLWASPPDVGDSVRGLAALSAGLDGATVVATTALGEVAALRPDGTIAWTGRPTTAALSFPTVVDAAPGNLPTAYAGSLDGNLYAIVVDGPLDATAPWPKAHHDLANTANASSPLP